MATSMPLPCAGKRQTLERLPRFGPVPALSGCSGERGRNFRHTLVQTTEIRMFDLIESCQDQGGGTWIHPKVTIDLAQ